MSTPSRLLVVLLVLGVAAAGVALFWRLPRPAGPEVAGSAVPDETFDLDFTRFYDVRCSTGGEVTAFRGVKVVGLTGTASFRGGPLFNRWLVLQYADGRKVYVPPHAIVAIEEPPPKMTK